MSLILAINTASKETAVALVEGKPPDATLLTEQSWVSEANESQKVLPAIQEMLQKTDKTWEDLSEIFVVKGPGSYTSLRVGITIANTLAWKLDIPMLTTDTFEIWEARLSEKERQSKHHIAIQSGRDKFLLKGDTLPRLLNEIEKLNEPCYGEIGDPSKTFGEAIINLNFSELQQVKTVEPFYVRPPDITHPGSIPPVPHP